jgi:hypothetical protein
MVEPQTGDQQILQTPLGFSQVCQCGRSFTHINALSNHHRSCPTTKKRLHDALAKAKEMWHSRKRIRTERPPTPGLVISASSSPSKEAHSRSYPHALVTSLALTEQNPQPPPLRLVRHQICCFSNALTVFRSTLMVYWGMQFHSTM